MGNNVIARGHNDRPIAPDALLKVTALIYLKEALLKERFEECAELIETAKKFGAQQGEISRLIAGVIREGKGGAKGGPSNGANQRKKGRPRFYPPSHLPAVRQGIPRLFKPCLPVGRQANAKRISGGKSGYHPARAGWGSIELPQP